MSDIVTGLALGGLSGLGALASSSLSYKNQKKLLDRQNAFTEKMWNASNDYNTPYNQRKRFELAGINPAFALGQMTPGSAAQVSSSGAPSANAPDFTGAMQSGISAYNAYQTKRMNDAQIYKTEAETDQINAYNAYAGMQAQANLVKTINEADYLDEQQKREYLDNLFRNRSLEDRLETVRKTNDELDSKIALNKAETDIKKYDLQFILPQQLANMINEGNAILQNIAESKSRIRLNSATIEKYAQDIIESEERTTGYHWDAEQKRKLTNYVVDDMRSQIAQRYHQTSEMKLGPITIKGVSSPRSKTPNYYGSEYDFVPEQKEATPWVQRKRNRK